jgi:hypothetical protein
MNKSQNNLKMVSLAWATNALGYNLEHKTRWLESIDLARTRIANRHEFEASSIQHQHDFIASWMSDAMVAPP